MESPPVQYADTGDGLVAYQVGGSGPDLLLATALFGGGAEAGWMIPGIARMRRFLASFSRVITLDYRGMGASDPLPPDRLGDMDEWALDIATVLDAVGSSQATLWGEHVAAHACVRYALEHPTRVRSLCLMNSAARFSPGDGYDMGIEPELLDGFVELLRTTWGTGKVYGRVLRADGVDVELAARYERTLGARTSMVHAQQATLRSDARDLLPKVTSPTLVVHTGDVLVDVDQAEDLRDRIAGAELAVLTSTSLYWGAEHADVLLRWILGGEAAWGEADLATILFTDVVGSTDRARSIGDTAWRRELDALDAFVAVAVAERGGRVVKQTGDGHLVEVRSPSDAVRLAIALARGARSLGTPIRVGVHVGEILRRDDDIAGIAVHAAARIASLARADEVLVSRTVRDLTRGAGFDFDPRGEHDLKGLDESWDLFAVGG